MRKAEAADGLVGLHLRAGREGAARRRDAALRRGARVPDGQREHGLRAVGADGRDARGLRQRRDDHRRAAAHLQQDPAGGDHQGARRDRRRGGGGLTAATDSQDLKQRNEDVNMTQGTIVQCIGAVVDVEFARTEMPKIYDALKMDEIGLTLEVQQQLGDGVVRTIALGSSDGLRRGMKVVNTGKPIIGARGRQDARPHHGRAGPPDRRARPGRRREDDVDPPQRADVRGAVAVDRAARDRHQGDRPDLPVRQGRQDRPLRRRRRRQDGHDDGAHQQHRDGALGPVGVRRRGRAHARGQRLLPRDDGIGRGRTRTTSASRRSRWCTAR